MKLPILLLALLGLPAQATWYQVAGQAPLDNPNPSAAAKADALAQARFYAGLREDMTNTSDRVIPLVRQTQTVNEYEEDGLHKVTLLVELDDSAQYQCWQQRPISIHRLNWATPDQAVTGLVGDPGQGIAAELARLLRARQSALVAVGPIGASLDQPQGSDIRALQQLSERQGSRWLLGGRLVRIRDQRQDAPWYTPWRDDSHQLSMAMDTWLLDSFSGKRVFERRYLAQAELPTGTLLDTQDPSFWVSPLGQNLQRQLQQLITDVETALPCQESQWPIVSVSNEGILIDAGLKAGLHPDDGFEVLLKRTLITATGERRQVLVPSRDKLSISWQSDSQTLLMPAKPNQELNLQAGDFVVKRLN
ncbi:flagella assembly protein FlgT middle domain-containing protein [Gallaecimonas xiamenensis]|uniref:Lipoprotein n=1 Tax=Gallaecimonas xiamenensis 3-C-1 TaxID=745411 RepID=K2JJG5_9GAMM|nr:flagella assembly protein FlgT middle domain-containing protein [Gallaecimonas xiamenensis]EKE75463.1 hypothetical protein B3C1_07294 [Gallaecimonas xiamenensis 3-C-1]